jgi:methylthioribose-1-phosphate isomerase
MKTIDFVDNKIKIIDQTQLPARLKYVYIRNLEELRRAIKTMQVRGAPALGAAVGLGVYLGARLLKTNKFSAFQKGLKKTIDYIGSIRPTARNLFWALERMQKVSGLNRDRPVSFIKKMLLKEAKEIIREDREVCRKIGYYGAKLIKDKDTILTICNAGILATVDYGTALGVIYRAKLDKKHLKVFACETRPMLQGARLTTWELKKNKIDVTLVCDSMAATLMAQGKIKKVIVGADRVAQNGDTANKIGTYTLAVLSRYHGIPFYVALPSSTFDLSLKSGRQIPIEERKQSEVSELFFKCSIAAAGTKIYNPAFDITPAHLISAFITDRGVIRPPYRINLKRLEKS